MWGPTLLITVGAQVETPYTCVRERRVYEEGGGVVGKGEFRALLSQSQNFWRYLRGSCYTMNAMIAV